MIDSHSENASKEDFGGCVFELPEVEYFLGFGGERFLAVLGSPTKRGEEVMMADIDERTRS